MPRSQRKPHFPPDCFPRHNILKHASAVYAKLTQVLTNTNKSLLQKLNFRHCETKKFSAKNRDTRYVSFFGKETWYGEIVKTCIFEWTVLITRFLCKKFFDTRNFPNHNVPLQKNFGTVRQYYLMKNRDTPVSHKFDTFKGGISQKLRTVLIFLATQT